MTDSSDLRLPAQINPSVTQIIHVAPDANTPGGFNVESGGELPGNASNQEIMLQIATGSRSPLPPRDNPFDLIIKAATKIVFHLDEPNWMFTERQMRLKDGSQNDTQNPDGGVDREFGGLGWVTDSNPNHKNTISIVDTWRRMETFEYGLFIKIAQGTMETTIEIDPKVKNEGGG